jgi:hypothetical protein
MWSKECAVQNAVRENARLEPCAKLCHADTRVIDDTSKDMKRLWKILGFAGAIVGGGYTLLVELAHTKPKEAQTNIEEWLATGRAFATWVLSSLPPWLKTELAAVAVAFVIVFPLICWGLWAWYSKTPSLQLWKAGRDYNNRTTYLPNGESIAISLAIHLMSMQASQGRWISAQYLEASSRPIDDLELMSRLANTEVLTELVEGRLTAYGRTQYEYKSVPIHKEYWNYKCFDVKRDDATLFHITWKDRSQFSESFRRTLPQYTEIFFNSEEFQKVFPKRNKVTEIAIRRVLKKAKAKGVAVPEILMVK